MPIDLPVREHFPRRFLHREGVGRSDLFDSSTGTGSEGGHFAAFEHPSSSSPNCAELAQVAGLRGQQRAARRISQGRFFPRVSLKNSSSPRAKGSRQFSARESLIRASNGDLSCVAAFSIVRDKTEMLSGCPAAFFSSVGRSGASPAAANSRRPERSILPTTTKCNS